MGKVTEAEKRDAERQLASLPKKQRTAARIEVAVAQQRILAGKYGKFTPQTNRVAAAAEDMGLSGRSKQVLREQLLGEPETRTLDKFFDRVDAPAKDSRQEPLNAQEPCAATAPSNLVREITDTFFDELAYIYVKPAKISISPTSGVQHDEDAQIHLQHMCGNVYTLPFTYSGASTAIAQNFQSLLDRIDRYLTTSVFTDAFFDEDPSTSRLSALAAEPAVAERLRHEP